MRKATSSCAKPNARDAPSSCSPRESLQDKADWPTDSIDEIFYMPDQNHEWNRAGHRQGGQLSGAHPRHRPHRGARRFRRRTGRRPARAPATPRHGRDHRPPFPRQARHAHEGSRGRHQRPGLRPRAQLRCAAALHGKHARSLGAQAPVHGRRDRDQEDPPRRGTVARHRVAGRYAVLLSAGAVRSRRYLPRRLHRFRKAGGVRHRLRLRASADGSLARRRHFHHQDSGARERRCAAPGGGESSA